MIYEIRTYDIQPTMVPGVPEAFCREAAGQTGLLAFRRSPVYGDRADQPGRGHLALRQPG